MLNEYNFKRIGTYSTGHANFGIFRGTILMEDGWYTEDEAQARVNYLQSLADKAGPTWPFDNTKLNLVPLNDSSLSPGMKILSSI